jgi:long-chain acyl-CoA synthetase
VTPGAAASADRTLPQRLAELAQLRPDAVALQEKRYGIWHPISWAAYHASVGALAHGLAARGVRRGDVVAIVGDNRPEWLITELAVQCLGAAVVGIYPTSTGDEIQHILELAGVRVVVAEDQEQVDKLLALRPVPSGGLAHILYCDPRGLEHYRDERLAELVDVAEDGRRDAEARPGWLRGEIAAGAASDCAVICATAATGRPRLARLSHRNLLATADQLLRLDPLGPGQRHVSFVPLAWIGEQVLAVACALVHELTLAFPEDTATHEADLREIGPHVVLGPPALWDSLRAGVQKRIADAGWLKRRVLGWAYRVGGAVADCRLAGRAPSWRLRAAHAIADAICLASVRDHLGLSRVQRGYAAGAPLAPEVLRFFHATGVNLKQLYGPTEICGIAACHRDDDVRLHTVGTPLPRTEIRIASDGEILLRSPCVFGGYVGDPDASARAVDGDGWLHTGDTGHLDGDHLVLDLHTGPRTGPRGGDRTGEPAR